MISSKSGIYTWTNLINNKIYVGYCTHFNTRKNGHVCSLKKGNHHNTHLQQAWNLYGEENFVFEELEECELQYLCALEHYWCIMLDTHNKEHGYNIEPTNPEGKNKKISKETRDKLSISNRGKRMSQKTKDIISECNSIPILMFDKNGILVKEFASSIEASLYLKLPHSVQISAILNNRIKSCKGFTFIRKNEYNITNDYSFRCGRNREYIQCDLEGNFIREFRCGKDIEIFLNKENISSNISACCNGRRNHAYGFIWKYKN